MRTAEYVSNTLSQMGILKLFGTKREVGELPSILHDDEELLYVTSGKLPSSGLLFSMTTWLAAATSERVIFLDKGFFFGMSQIEIPLEKISSIGYTTSLFCGHIAVWDGSEPMKVMFCPKNTLKPFVDAVNAAKKHLGKQHPSASDHKNMILELERLAALKEKGILDEDEFLAEKHKLMTALQPKEEPKITAASLAGAYERTESARIKDHMGLVWAGVVLFVFLCVLAIVMDESGLLDGI